MGEFVEQRKTIEVETLRHQQSTFPRNSPETPAEDRQKYGEDKVGRLIKSMCGTQDASHIWQLDYVNLICGELGGFGRGKHSAALFHNPNQDVASKTENTVQHAIGWSSIQVPSRTLATMRCGWRVERSVIAV